MKDLYVRVTVAVAMPQGQVLRASTGLIEIPDSVPWTVARRWSMAVWQIPSWASALGNVDATVVDQIYSVIDACLDDERVRLDRRFNIEVDWKNAKVEWFHKDGTPYSLTELDARYVKDQLMGESTPVRSRDCIDEVEGLYLKVTFTLPRSVTGVQLRATVTVPTGGIPWDILREYIYDGKIKDRRDEGYLTTKLEVPITRAIYDELCQKYNLGHRERKAIRNHLGLWTPNVFLWRRSQFSNIEFVKADGSSAKDLLVQLERDYVRGLLLGEGARDDVGWEDSPAWHELGWVDPNGDFVPRGLYADVDVKLKRSVLEVELTFRVSVPRDVVWEDAAEWVKEWIKGACGDGLPINMHRLALSAEDEQRLDHFVKSPPISSSPYFKPRPRIVSISEPRWVKEDGTPYPIEPTLRRQVKRRLMGEAQNPVARLLLAAG